MQELKFQGEVLVVRDPSTVSAFNRKGITLATIECEVTWAKLLVERENLRGIMELEVKMTEELASAWGSAWLPPDIYSSSAFQLACVDCGTLLLNEDKNTAEMIGRCPIALLYGKDAKEAIARWLYVLRVANTPKVRHDALELLHIAGLKGYRGTPPTFRLDMKQLAQAYKDLIAYHSALHRCMKTTRDISRVLDAFPDCGDVRSIIGTTACFPLSDIAARGGTNLPGATVFSHAFLAHKIGCSRKAVESWRLSTANPSRA